MISEKKSRLTEVIQELEVVLNDTKEKEHSLRLERAINTLKQNSVTFKVKGTEITLFTDDIEEVELDEGLQNKVVNSVAVVEFSEPMDENGAKFVDTKVVADYYGVTTETVRNWIKEGKISGKQLAGNRGKYFIPVEEFEYLKKQREKDDTEEAIKEILGEEYTEDWDVELNEDE